MACIMKCKTCNHLLKNVTCPTCNEKHCVQCLFMYILDSIHPLHCSSCHHEWYELTSVFSVSMMVKYKARRSHLLFLKDQSYFASYQPEIKRQQSQEKISEKVKILIAKIHENNKEEEQLVSQQRQTERLLREELDELVRIFKKNEATKINHSVIAIRTCSNQDCRGIIIQSKEGYQCDLCHQTVCLHCKTIHDTFFFCSVDKKQCPSCSYTVYQTGSDEAVCFACHHVFSWSKPTYFIHSKNKTIQPSAIPINFRPDSQIRPYFLLLRHLRRFSYSAYNEYLHPSVDKAYDDRMSYLSGKISLDVYKDRLYKLNQKLFRLRHERELLIDYIHQSETILTKPILIEEIEPLVGMLQQLAQNIQTKINDLEGKGILHSSSFVV